MWGCFFQIKITVDVCVKLVNVSMIEVDKIEFLMNEQSRDLRRIKNNIHMTMSIYVHCNFDKMNKNVKK